MTTVYPEILETENIAEQFFNIISFVKEFPLDVPVYVTCHYPNHGDVRMLVIPRYYHSSAFRCTVLAIDAPLIPQGHLPLSGIYDEINISVFIIKSWKLWSKEDHFLNFGNGFITERYLEMLFN